MERRDFLKTSALISAALAASPLEAVAAKDKPTVKRYQEIGKTGLKMSDISFGTGRLPSSSMVLRAIDRGINYFDTAPDYGSAEEYIGAAMNRIQRDKVILASKFCTPHAYPSHLPPESSKKDYIESIEASLSRMKTDYLDFCFVHAIGEQSKSKDREMTRLLDEDMLSAFQTLKQAGKVRFLAVSSHGPDNMEDLLLAAVHSGHFDMIMTAFNFMKFPRLPDVFKEAKKKGVGVIAMKTLAGAKDVDFDSKGEEFAPAAFKWVLNYPEVNGLVITIRSVSDLDLYLTASGGNFTASDQRALDRYTRRYDKEYCRTGCNECEIGCPLGVEIAKSLRYQMYFKDYGMEKKAMESYAALAKNACACMDCDEEFCSGACPYGLPLRALLRETHEMLTFVV